MTGTTQRAAHYLLGRLRELRNPAQSVCLISGGEVTVKVRGDGVGGRNQQFALACAPRSQARTSPCSARVPMESMATAPPPARLPMARPSLRAKACGLDTEGALANFNAYPFFEALGDAIVTGPTGNNLRDLRILLAHS